MWQQRTSADIERERERERHRWFRDNHFMWLMNLFDAFKLNSGSGSVATYIFALVARNPSAWGSAAHT